GDVAGNSRVEGLTQSGVKDDLSRGTRVDAAQDRGRRVLASDGRALLREVVMKVDLAAAEAFVALAQPREHLIGRQLVAFLLGERRGEAEPRGKQAHCGAAPEHSGADRRLQQGAPPEVRCAWKMGTGRWSCHLLCLGSEAC